VNYEVANLPALITSHDADFRVNPRYPAQLQPRARDSAPARDQVNSIAARLQPERLGRSPRANSGAPVVGPDNVVESGNGRTLALGKAYSSARVRIPTKPAMHSERKPATDSDLKPAGIPI
jgi:hypothetical protein